MSDPDADARRIYAHRRPVSDLDARRYLLPAAEGIRIFREQIVPDLLAGRQPQATPAVVFLIGQQGAGKSRVASMVGDVLNNRGGFAELDSDLYKPYHPQYDELMRRDDTLMAAYIGPDSWAWLAQAHQYVRAHQVNVLKPETGAGQPGRSRELASVPGCRIPGRGGARGRLGAVTAPNLANHGQRLYAAVMQVTVGVRGCAAGQARRSSEHHRLTP